MKRTADLGEDETTTWVTLDSNLPTVRDTEVNYKNISFYAIMIAAKTLQDPKVPRMFVKDALGIARFIRGELSGWIRSYAERSVDKDLAFEKFKRDWITLRVWVPLQIRLASEQIFWELGGKYRTLISGFGPIE